jgi:hypothetical protein
LQLGSGVRLRQNKKAADRGKPIPGHGNGRDSLLKEQPGGRYLWAQERQSNQYSHPLLTSATDIAKEMGVAVGTISKLATKAISEGRLKKDGRGYTLH